VCVDGVIMIDLAGAIFLPIYKRTNWAYEYHEFRMWPST